LSWKMYFYREEELPSGKRNSFPGAPGTKLLNGNDRTSPGDQENCPAAYPRSLDDNFPGSLPDAFRDDYPSRVPTTCDQTMTQVEHPVVLILGAGAVGLSLAGKLADVASVYAACRPRHAGAIRRQGLGMKGIWGEKTVIGISCIPGPAEAPASPDYVVITAKGTDTLAICEEYAAVIRDRPVISLQNGIGNEEIIASFTSTVIGGTITTNFAIEGPGAVKVLRESGPVTLGLWSTGPGGTILDRLIRLVRSAGIPVEASPDIRAGKWTKALLNIAVNPLTALLGVPVGTVQDEYLRRIVTALIEETFAVMDAEEVRLPWKTAGEYLDYLYTVQIPDFAPVYTSMYYDLREGKRTEIELLNGYVAQLGERHSIPTPYNHCIGDLVRFREPK
jgi:2-dehydropantoate 2-reductase